MGKHYYASSQYGFFCQVNNFLYTLVWLQSVDEPDAVLCVCERGNCLGGNALLGYVLDLEHLASSLPRIEFVAEPMHAATNLHNDGRILKELRSWPHVELRRAMRALFVRRGAFEQQTMAVRAAHPSVRVCDVGVQIRRGDKLHGEMQELDVGLYVTATRTALETRPTRGRRRRRVFVMSDDFDCVQAFRAHADAEWDVVTMVPSDARGHDQGAFNEKSLEYKSHAVNRLFAEVSVMHECPLIIGSASSNVFRFIYLTHVKEGEGWATSLDLPLSTVW